MRNVHLILLVYMQQQQLQNVRPVDQQQRLVPLGHSCLKNLF